MADAAVSIAVPDEFAQRAPLAVVPRSFGRGAVSVRGTATKSSRLRGSSGMCRS